MSESQCITTILDADNINHIVVFLTGVTPLPDGMAGIVYFSWPDPNAPPNWQQLGHISNQKPSAIFKVSNLKKLHEISDCTNVNTFGMQNICHNAQIGISIEPLGNVRDVPSPTTTSYLSFTQKMLESFINYVSSFSVNQSNMMPNPNENFVPLSTIQNWYQTFERRLQQNPNFWKSM